MTQLNLHVQSIFGNNWTVWVVEDIYSTFDTNDGAKYNSQFNTLNKNYALKPGCQERCYLDMEFWMVCIHWVQQRRNYCLFGSWELTEIWLLSDSQLSLNRDEFWWFLMVPEGSGWFVMVCDGFWWFLIVPYGSWWILMLLDCSWWFLMVPDSS